MTIPSGLGTGLLMTGTYFNQVISLSPYPTYIRTDLFRTKLVNLIMSVLTNPFFYAVIGIIVIMSILPTVDD